MDSGSSDNNMYKKKVTYAYSFKTALEIMCILVPVYQC